MLWFSLLERGGERRADYYVEFSKMSIIHVNKCFIRQQDGGLRLLMAVLLMAILLMAILFMAILLTVLCV